MTWWSGARPVLGAATYGAIVFLALVAPEGPVRATDDIQLPTPVSEKEGMEAYSRLPAQLTFEAAEKIYRERGYDLLLADASVLNARGVLESSGQVANPTIGASYGHSFGGITYPDGFSVSLSDNAALLDTIAIGKRALKIEVAQAALDSQKMSRTDAQRTLLAAFKQQWVACVAAHKQVEEDRNILDSQKETLDLIQKRLHAGTASEVDTAQQSTAMYEAAQQVASAQQSYEQAKAGLAYLLGVRGKTPHFDVDPGLFDTGLPDKVQSATAESLQQYAYDHRPDLAAERLQVHSAQASMELARRQIVPDIALGLSYAQQGTGNAAITPPTLSVDVSVTPPLFYQQQGEITQAQSNLRTQQVTLAKMESQILSDVDTAYAAFFSARERLNRLENGYLQQSKLAADLTKVQYEKGAASLVDYLVAERNYITTVQEYVQSKSDAWTAVFQLEAAVGGEFVQ